MAFKIDYEKLLLLDAEDLAEGGIRRAYEAIRHLLAAYLPIPAPIEEFLDNRVPRYSVKCRGREYLIYSPELPGEEGQSWGRAAHAFFSIVDDQLTNSEHKLYAINGGNDLSGIFLTKDDCEAARKSLPKKQDWPYLPTLDHPWYGQPHD